MELSAYRAQRARGTTCGTRPASKQLGQSVCEVPAMKTRVFFASMFCASKQVAVSGRGPLFQKC